MSYNRSPSVSSRTGSRSPARRLRILIAEDDADSAASLEMLLQNEGHETRCVYHGRDVVKTACDFAADAVLLDIGMPGVTGYDVARAFRMLYGSAKPVLIAVTARGASADKVMAKAAGIDHHFAKPYDPHELLGLLADLAAHAV